MKKTDAIIIMDGFALSPATEGNAIAKSGTPNINALMGQYPHTALEASGLAVGLPEGFMGNSEVGHTNIGAGRIVYQYFTMINKAIKEGEFDQNPAFLKAINSAKQNGKALHIMGLLSDGGVHSHIDHLFHLVKLCKKEGIKKLYIHVFTDGRDVPPDSGLSYIERLEEFLKKEKTGKIASVCGRYFAMDRDKNWERVERAYRLLACGEGEEFATASEAAKHFYSEGVTDEFFPPAVIKGGAKISEGDSVIFFNFRRDRAGQLTAALTQQDFTNFSVYPLNLTYVCMSVYEENLQNVLVAFLPQNLSNTLGEYLSKTGRTQLHIAETEKYNHVTSFFNAGAKVRQAGEEWILIDSPAVATFDLKPEMSAYEVTEAAKGRIGQVDCLILNLANCDMVGHTGNFDAAVRAAEVVDECVGKLTEAILKTGGCAIVTADHGNAEKMSENDKPFTAHTLNKVPFILAGKGLEKIVLREDGVLADIAPTFLEILGLPVPAEMTGKSLIKQP